MTRLNLLVLGATSDMAMAVAHRFAKAGYDIQLAARAPEQLAESKADLNVRHQVDVSVHAFDALKTNTFDAFIDGLDQLPDVVVSAIGFMGIQEENEEDVKLAAKVLRSNFEGPALIFTLLANRFEERGSGTLVGISSVAGDRGRATNYVYGSAKAGFTAFLSGLRNRLASTGVHVVTVNPGFVRTRMLDGMTTPGALTAEPSEVGDAVFKAVERGRDIIYVRPIWWLVMMVIKSIPEKIFKKMSL